MSKLTSKRQVTVPKEIADRYRLGPGDEIRWIPAGSEIRVIPSRGPTTLRLGIDERLALFDRATERRDQRARLEGREVEPVHDRGWTREEIHERGRAR